MANHLIKLKGEDISKEERLEILFNLGEIVQDKYDEFVIQGQNPSGKKYNLYVLKGFLKFQPDTEAFENYYYLEGTDMHWTKIANYFEYGTGIHNQQFVGRSYTTGRFQSKGVIKPLIQQYMTFMTKAGRWVQTDRVEGVYPVAAMSKAIAFGDNLISEYNQSIV